MQTFLPYKRFDQSARCLDVRRLGKQRVEAWQILQHIDGKQSAWINHPAVRMWQGHRDALIRYYNAMLAEWDKRGYRNIKLRMIEDKDGEQGKSHDPEWLTSSFCLSHRSNLLRKNKAFYSRFKWSCSENLPYIWPA